eukprot:8300572-Pyramimonas_sp.AAC.1
MPGLYPIFLGIGDRTDPAEAKKEKGREKLRAFRKKREPEESEEAKQIRLEKKRIQNQRYTAIKNPINNAINNAINNPINNAINNLINNAINNAINNPINNAINNAINNLINNAKLKAEQEEENAAKIMANPGQAARMETVARRNEIAVALYTTPL